MPRDAFKISRQKILRDYSVFLMRRPFLAQFVFFSLKKDFGRFVTKAFPNPLLDKNENCQGQPRSESSASHLQKIANAEELRVFEQEHL